MRSLALSCALLLVSCTGGEVGEGAGEPDTAPARDSGDSHAPDTGEPTDTGPDTGEPTDTGEPDDTGEPTDTGEPDDDGVHVAVELAAANPLAVVVTVATSDPAEVVAVASLDGEELDREASDPGTTHDLVLAGLYAESHVLVEVTVGDEVHREYVETPVLPTHLPDWEVTVPGDPDGFIAMANGKGPFMPGDPLVFAVDGEGAVRWMYLTDEAMTATEADVEALDDGSLRILGAQFARRVDLAGRTLAGVSPEDAELDRLHHDARPLPDDGWLLLAHEYRDLYIDVDETELVTGDRLVELDGDGEIQWTWSAFDHLDPDDRTALSDGGAPGIEGVDWTHANAVIHIDELDGWLLSLRNLHRMVLIDDETGAIRWSFGVDGDFTLTTGQWFYGAHAPEWDADEDTLLLFDNGVSRPGGPWSRVVRYRLDPEARTATELWSYDLRAYSSSMGDVDTLGPDRMLVTAGAINDDPESPEAWLQIVDNDGVVHWELVAEALIYRAERIELR